MDSKIQFISQNPKIHLTSQNNPKTKTPSVTKKPAFNAAALLVGATAGLSISAGEGAGEIPVYLCLGDNTTTSNFWPCSQ